MNLLKYRGFRLVIVLIVLIIIGIVIGNRAMKMMEQKKYDDLKTDFLLIEAKVKILKGKADVSSSKDCYLGVKVSEANNEEIANFLRSLEINDEEFENYFILYTQDFEQMQIKEDLRNLQDGVYIVNYDNQDILYIKGVSKDGVTKYKITEILKDESQVSL